MASVKSELMVGRPERKRNSVRAGDVVMLPVGTGYCQIEASADYHKCRGYLLGQKLNEKLRAEHRALRKLCDAR